MLRAQAPAPIPCDDCSAPCCRSQTVQLDGLDLLRLTQALCMPASAFAELHVVEAPEPVDEHRILLSGNEQPERRRWHALTLRKVPEPESEYRFRCVFLVAVGERGRCGVRAMQPGQCAAFPFRLAGGAPVLDDAGLCPPGAWDVARLDVARRRDQHLARARRLALDQALIAGWNERLLAEHEAYQETVLYSYLHNTWRDLLRLEPSLATDAAPPASAPSPEALVDRILVEMSWRAAPRAEVVA